MTLERRDRSVTMLRLVLGGVVFIQSLALVLSHQSEAIAPHPALVAIIRALGVVEIAGAVLFLLPWTIRVGGWVLLAVFAAAIALHALHGEWGFGSLVVYSAAVLVVLAKSGTVFSLGPAGNAVP